MIRETNKKYLWLADPQTLMTIQLTKINGNEDYQIYYEKYLAPLLSVTSGTISWNKKEWEKALLLEYKKPLTLKDIDSDNDNELCGVCHGRYYHIRDYEDCIIEDCKKCNGSGKAKKKILKQVLHRRSLLHPPIYD